ncbi:MAG TPA: XkdF-like putative serine protease domain-containing protein [Gammaproteobacteria bacterium]|nr:XkdF-like putative serine protease domain-containing protein [Gammaproteobacteria bacterium]
MPTLLKNMHINEISLVKTGANGAQFIAKSADEAPRLLMPIKKTDAAKQIAAGWVYAPDVEDSQGEISTAEEIEKAAWYAMKNQAVVKTDHEQEAPAFIAESYIVKTNDPDGFPEGAWAVVVKIEDAELWKKVESGEYQAFSMGGAAVKEPVDKGDTPRGEQPVEKEVSIDSMVYASGLKDVLAVVNGIAQNLGDVVNKVAELQKAQGQAPQEGQAHEEPQGVGELRKQMEQLQATVTKIAEHTTDGRATSPEPGHTTIDPARY